jgi:hypothetical protein
MIYGALFGMDEKGVIKPQMVEKYTASGDNKVWTFTLRPRLKSMTVHPSLRRTWSRRSDVAHSFEDMPSLAHPYRQSAAPLSCLASYRFATCMT